MKAKPIYKIIDEKGRILIPKALRTSSGMDVTVKQNWARFGKQFSPTFV